MDGDAGLHVTTEVALRSRDFDGLGHVNQAVYHELLEEARIALFRAAVPDGLFFVLARVELDHRGEIARGDDRVVIGTRVVRVGRSSVEVAHDLRVPGGPVVAEEAVESSWPGIRDGAARAAHRRRARRAAGVRRGGRLSARDAAQSTRAPPASTATGAASAATSARGSVAKVTRSAGAPSWRPGRPR